MSSPQKTREGKRDLTAGPLGVTLFRLALPVAIGNLLQALYSMVDAFWLGRVSKEALGAPGVSMPFMFIVIAFGMGFGSAGTALVGQFTGAGRHREADRAAAQTLLLLSCIAVSLALPLILFTDPILRLVNVPDEVRPVAVPYLRILMLGVPLLVFNIAYGAVLRALGDTVTWLLIGAAGNALNLLLDPLLIFGWGPFPALGAKGAAVVTVFSQFLASLVIVALVRRHHAGLHVRLADFRPERSILRRMVGVGLPAAITNSSNSFSYAIFQAMINSLGPTVVAAFFVGFRIIHLFNVPAEAMAIAAGPVVAQSLGAGKPSLARRAVLVSVGVVAGIMFLPLVFLMWRGPLVAGLFVRNQPEVIAETARFFLMVPASTYCFSVLMVLNAAFYGSGHTRPTMMVAIIRTWCLRLPAAWILAFVLGWGSRGAYLGMVIGNVLSAALTLWLFLTYAWQVAIVSHPSEDPSSIEVRNGGAASRATEPGPDAEDSS